MQHVFALIAGILLFKLYLAEQYLQEIQNNPSPYHIFRQVSLFSLFNRFDGVAKRCFERIEVYAFALLIE